MKRYNIGDLSKDTRMMVNTDMGNVFYKTADGYVKKLNTRLYNSMWGAEIEEISSVVVIPAFKGLIISDTGYVVGYMMDYIDGTDLQEDKPFEHRHDKVRVKKLNKIQEEMVLQLILTLLIGAIGSGYLICDITKRNIMLDNKAAYLVDLDTVCPIVNGKLEDQSQIDILQETLDMLKIDYVFDGDINKLYKRICLEL